MLTYTGDKGGEHMVEQTLHLMARKPKRKRKEPDFYIPSGLKASHKVLPITGSTTS